MKVKALMDIVGIDYALKDGETGEIKDKTALMLIKFNHVEEVKQPKASKSKVSK